MANMTQPRYQGINDSLIFLALGSLLGIAIVISLLSFFDLGPWWVVGNPESAHWLESFFRNTGTEFFGALLTFFLIDTVLRKRREVPKAVEVEQPQAQEQQQREAQFAAMQQAHEAQLVRMQKELQKSLAEETRRQIKQLLVDQQEQLYEQERRQLVNQLTSRFPGFAAEAVRLLRYYGWFKVKMLEQAVEQGGDFSKAKFWSADLSEANLEYAQMNQADLSLSQLQRTSLRGAQLRDAALVGAQLEEGDLTGAELEGASLRVADLRRVNLSGANLKDADLSGANLQGALLLQAQLEGSNLRGVPLDGAVLLGANLRGATHLMIGQLKQAQSLEGVTLPDGCQLPGRRLFGDTRSQPAPDWITPFEAWCETATIDREGYIIAEPVNGRQLNARDYDPGLGG